MRLTIPEIQIIEAAVKQDIFASDEAGAIKFLKELAVIIESLPTNAKVHDIEIEGIPIKVRELLVNSLQDTPVMSLLAKLK